MPAEGTTANLTVSIPLDSYAPRAARHHVGQVDRPSPDLRDAVALLTSELVTQAVARCQFPGAMVVLRVWMPPDVVRVELRAPRTFMRQQSHSEESESSLKLVRHLADRWSLDGSGDYACLWFEIDRHYAGFDQPSSSEAQLQAH